MTDYMQDLADALIQDVKAVLPDEPFIATRDLVAAVIDQAPNTWGADTYYGRDLTPQRLGRVLAHVYGVRSVRHSNSARGYRTDDLRAA